MPSLTRRTKASYCLFSFLSLITPLIKESFSVQSRNVATHLGTLFPTILLFMLPIPWILSILTINHLNCQNRDLPPRIGSQKPRKNKITVNSRASTSVQGLITLELATVYIWIHSIPGKLVGIHTQIHSL